MQNFGAVIGQLGRFAHVQLRHHVRIGHDRAVVHGCRIEDDVLVTDRGSGRAAKTA